MDDPLASGNAGNATPRWVKVFGLIGALFAILFVVLHLTGNGMGHEHHHGHHVASPGSP